MSAKQLHWGDLDDTALPVTTLSTREALTKMKQHEAPVPSAPSQSATGATTWLLPSPEISHAGPSETVVVDSLSGQPVTNRVILATVVLAAYRARSPIESTNGHLSLAAHRAEGTRPRPHTVVIDSPTHCCVLVLGVAGAQLCITESGTTPLNSRKVPRIFCGSPQLEQAAKGRPRSG